MKKALFLLIAMTLVACSDDVQTNNGTGSNNKTNGTTGEVLPDGVTKNGDTYTDAEGRSCTELTPCKNCDETCKPAGNPFAGNNGTGNNGSGSNNGTSNNTNNTNTGGGDTVCSELDVNFSTPIATVVLLIDQSGSMLEDFGGGQTRFEATYDSLMDPNDGLVVELQESYRFGFALYTSYNGGPTCPELSDVKPSLNNFGPIDTVFSQAKPEDDTPTGESIRGVMRMYDGFDDGPNVLLVATDGDPDSCAIPDGDRTEAIQLSLDATKEAFDADVSTYILSVGTGVAETHLQEVANLGVGLAKDGSGGNAPFFNANNIADLKKEMKGIITSTRGCTFKLDGSILDLALLDRGTVVVNGKEVLLNDPNGFKIYQDPNLCFGSKQCLELQGTACEEVKSGEVNVSGKFLCVYDDPIPGSEPETPGACATSGKDCLYSGDCCSGLCTGSGGEKGQCIVQ